MTLLCRAVLCVLAVSHIGIDHAQGYSGESCNTPTNERGTCLHMKDCPLLLDMLRMGSQNPNVTNYLRRSVCGYNDRDPVVCCPERNTGGRSNRGTTNVSITLPDTEVCGKRDLQNRISGGSDAEIGLFRWIAALGYRSPRQRKVSWQCAGSLVTDRHIITAAHCVVINNNPIILSVVRLGDLDLNDNARDGASPTDYEVDISIPHPEYRTFEKVNDIAVVRLKNKVTFTSLIQPICLPTLPEFRRKNFTGYDFYIAGWGAAAHRGSQTTKLQQAQVQLSDHQMCREAYYSVMKNAVIDSRVVCAGENGKDSCQGDSGGPLMFPDEQNGSFYLYGVVAYGYKCAEPGYPGVYTRVSEFMDWILLNLK